MKFGIILKNLLEEQNLTQSAFAKAINYTQRAVSKWVNGESEPTETAVIKTANYFGVSTDYLLGRTDELGNVAAMPPAAPALAEDERRLLECYRALEPDYKRLAIDTLGTWSGNPTKKGKTSRA